MRERLGQNHHTSRRQLRGIRQADLMLAYRATSRVYERARVFSPEKVKSKCAVEAILLDVRTGIVPFSGHVEATERWFIPEG